MVAPKRDAQPVLAQLRSSGHHVSVVEDLDEARAILGIGGFDQAVLQSSSLEAILRQRMSRGGDDCESWRRSAAAIIDDVQGLLSALAALMPDDDGRSAHFDDDMAALACTVHSLSSAAEELMQGLVSPTVADDARLVDLHELVETAAVLIYSSAAERRQRLTIDIHPDVATIQTVPTRLRRVVKVLLEFSSTLATNRGSVVLRGARDGDDCVISVLYMRNPVDRGDLAHGAISLFHNGSRPGPLTRAQELITDLDGKLWIESEKDGRVSVFVALPQAWNRTATMPYA